MHAVFSLLPLVAAILAVPQFVPQLARLARTGETAGVSWSWAALTSVNNAAWADYFALSGFWSALVPAISATVLACALAVMLARRGLDSRAAPRRSPWRGPRCSSPPRSEEHTSELQSRVDLVCRLL